MAAAYTGKVRVNSITEGSPGYAQVNLVENDIDPTRGRSTGATTIAVLLEESVNYKIGGVYTLTLTETTA